MLSSALASAPIKKRVTRVYGFGPLEKVKIIIWLFIKVFVWICKISMDRGKKLKKVCCGPEVQKQNVVTSKLSIKEQNVASLELTIEEQNVVSSKLTIKKQNAVGIKKPKVDEPSNQYNLKLDMVIVSNPSDEILPKTN